VGRIGISC